MRTTGRDLLARALAQAGIRFVVGREEGLLGPVFRHLRDEGGVTAISPRGDIAGAFMAYGNTYYEFFPALVLASTPAETVNALSGLGTAWGEKLPVFVITVRPRSRAAGSRPGITQGRSLAAFTKWSGEVARPEDIPRCVGQSIREGMGGCHGPVHLEIREEVLEHALEVEEEELEKSISAGLGSLTVPTIEGDPELIRRGLRMLMAAERPLVIAGGGVVHARAWEEMDRLVRMLEVPASTSMAGEGCVRGDNPFYIGGPSYLGGESFHRAIKRTDCVLVVGAALGGLEGFGQPPFWNADARFVQVDIDPVRVCLNIPVELSILGDAKAVLERMLEYVEAGEFAPVASHRPWTEHLLAVKRRWRARVEGEADASWPVLHQGYVCRVIRRACGPETFIAVDGGNTALWAGMFCMDHMPRSALAPAGMGTLGCGIPMAIGIKAADPRRPLVLIQGDGSFLYNVQELDTARRLGMDFVVVILNDGSWNMIKGAQDMFFGGRRVGSMLGDIDYAAVARGFGCYGRRVERAEEIEPAFREASASGLPAVLDVVVDPDNFPETLTSFALGEFEGVSVNPLRMLGVPRMKLDRRLLNRAKYSLNVILDKDLE